MQEDIAFSAKLALMVLAMLVVIGCGKKGPDGDVYLTIVYSTSSTYLQSYYDNNPGIPYGFHFNIPYLCSPGVYGYEYTTTSRTYTGTYTLTANEGKDGVLFSEGDKGDAKYYRLRLYTNGASMSKGAVQDIESATIDDSDIDVTTMCIPHDITKGRVVKVEQLIKK